VSARSRSKRANFNTGNSDETEQLIRSLIGDGPVIEQGNGGFKIQCPFHSDRGPSCSISPQEGVFKCFGCDEVGNVRKLVAKLTGGKTRMFKQMAASSGLVFRDPDSDVLAKYDYRDADGRLLKQVLRKADQAGEKVFKQRRPGVGGSWEYDLHTVQPTLFGMERLKDAEVVCITEGEKDARAITDLRLTVEGGLVIGVTSGASHSWDASFAKHLRGKRVVVMPDADEPGMIYAEAVCDSLNAERIEYSVIGFKVAGAKDVSEFLLTHTSEQLNCRIVNALASTVMELAYV
jgi:putative DNA primase/helicase